MLSLREFTDARSVNAKRARRTQNNLHLNCAKPIVSGPCGNPYNMCAIISIITIISIIIIVVRPRWMWKRNNPSSCGHMEFVFCR